MPIGPTRGRFLELITRIKSPRRVLEIGSGAGYCVMVHERHGPKGKLETIEVDRQVANELREVIQKAGLQRRIKVHHGAALKILRKLKGPYDLVFIDADKNEYPQYLQCDEADFARKILSWPIICSGAARPSYQECSRKVPKNNRVHETNLQ